MRLVVIDFESFFRTKDTEQEPSYTLSKMSTEAYIRDPRFQAHGVAIKWGADHAAKWYDPRQTEWVLKNEDWSDTFVVCHHAQFDGLYFPTTTEFIQPDWVVRYQWRVLCWELTYLFPLSKFENTSACRGSQRPTLFSTAAIGTR